MSNGIVLPRHRKMLDAQGLKFSAQPIEPTEAMIAAGLRVDFDNEDERATIINIWHAMSAAAPSNPNTIGD